MKEEKLYLKTNNNSIILQFKNQYFLYERLANSIHVGSKKEIERISKLIQDIKYLPTFESDSIKKRAIAPIDSLVFNVTESCNLSCDYCIYSGKYDRERTHNNKKMSFETAKNAMDSFLRSVADPLMISFYGGEPLMNFPLIEKIVDYSKSNSSKNKKIFSIATNFVNAEKYIDYLIENNFYIQISLDGPKEVHDKYRIDRKGNPTFDIIQKNIEKINSKKRGFTRTNVSLSATYKNAGDFSKIIEYFIGLDDEFASMRIGITETKGLKKNDVSSIGIEELLIYALKYVSFIENKKAPPKILKFLFEQNLEGIYNRSSNQIPEKLPLRGACYPGKRKLFVNTDGALYTCEKMVGKLPLGDINLGLNSEEINKNLDRFKDIRNDLCTNCWAARLCAPCLMSAKDPIKDISNEGLAEMCNALKSQTILSLLIYGLIKDEDKDRIYSSLFKLNHGGKNEIRKT